ncbi:SCO6880 family protein [Nocardioides ungokensis]|uniref:SCO6880 family protein n=1 Tax=Nocardioides ungokensis TaxID=1643322 RepID=UPI0015E01F66|nr:SCO6880 family protein [Nocardioides ungokensis]
MTVHDTPATHSFGRRDRGGLLLGLRAPQLGLLGIGCACLLLGLLSAGARGGGAGLAVLACLAFLALFPVQGRALVDWARPVANHFYARVKGEARYLGGPFALRRCDSRVRLDLPGLGQQLRLFETRTLDGPVAAMRIGERWTLVLSVRGANYVLADRASQERRISAWGALLSQAGQEGSRIAAVQWLERTIPDSGHDLARWWREHGDEQARYADAYAELIGRAGPAATRHEAYLAVSIDAHRLRRQIRRAGGGPEGTTKVLLGELAWIKQALRSADIEVLGTLDAADLGRLVRGQFDPVSSDSLDDDQRQRLPIAAGPVAAEGNWDHYRSDSGLHAVYWIAEWPSVPVEAAWFYPLLALGGVRRTVTLTYEPIPPSRSMRELRSLRVGKRADEAQRHRLGQVETVQDEEEYDALERRERELVRGHTEYRFTGWITVTATDRDQLEAACAQVEQAAVRSALEVRRIYGETDQAFLCAALPLTQGVGR